MKEIVTDSRGTLTTEVKNALNEGSSGNDPQATDADNAIADAAARVQEETKGAQPQVNPNSMAALGIEVVDVRIKQINLPAEVSEAIFQRMRAEREAVARRHRSQGLEEAMKIRAVADKTRTEILAEAERQSLSCVVRVMRKPLNCLRMHSVRIRISMRLSEACVLMSKASNPMATTLWC